MKYCHRWQQQKIVNHLAYLLEKCFDIVHVHNFRYLELSDEEREKLEGSYKVAKKLERLQSKKER